MKTSNNDEAVEAIARITRYFMAGTKFGIKDLSRVLGFVLFVCISGFSQTSQKAIVWVNPLGPHARSTEMELKGQINDVEIEDIYVNGKPVTIGQFFPAENDWIKTISARVKNLSDQPIAAVQITFAFPEADPGSPEMIICYGCATPQREKGVMPGETVDLKGRDDMYEWVRRGLSQKGSLSRISKAEIRNIFVTTASGRTWFSTCIKTLDPKSSCPILRHL